MYGEETLKERQCRNWFDKFFSENFSLKGEQRSGQPNEVDNDQIKAIIESDRHVPGCEFRSAARVGPSGHGWPYSGD